jgi:predicted ATP-dependent endonuclease of OLD family
MISSIRICNLRSLRDTNYIQLKKLNILVGSNSSGKSTFLRSFPLLKQSVNKDLRNAISWFDASFVDFGDYNTSRNKHAGSEPISFEFVLQPPFSELNTFYYTNSYSVFPRKCKRLADNKSIKVTIEYSDDESGTYVSQVIIKDDHTTYKVCSKNRNDDLVYMVDGTEVKGGSKIRFGRASQNKLIPTLTIENASQNDIDDHFRDVSSYYAMEARSFLKKYCSRRLKNENRLDVVIRKWSYQKTAFLKCLQKDTGIQSLKNRANKWTIDSSDFLDIYSRIGVLNLFDYLDEANKEITRYYSNCSYIAPVRAEASRYYRNQGLQIDDIDSYGRNLQEFISSLNDEMQESYKQYCMSVLGVYPKITPLGGQNSIILFSPSNNGTNLTDVGFGYSQILPIITKLWYSTQDSTPTGLLLFESKIDTILIEQPELHLHPAMQAKIADALIESAIKKKIIRRMPHYLLGISDVSDRYEYSCNIIVETHSPTIINRVGRRIREGQISENDVNVIVFEKESTDSDTKIRQVSYDSNGQLKDWPYGFFDPKD